MLPKLTPDEILIEFPHVGTDREMNAAVRKERPEGTDDLAPSVR